MLSNQLVIDDLRWKKFNCLSDGFVTLVDVMGDDACVVQAARVSYGRDQRMTNQEQESEPPEAATAKDRGLIRYMMRKRHTTPFEMAEIKLLIRCPMDCWRQWIRQRMASVNEYSTRYSEAIDSMDTTPEDGWRLQSDSNKQGSGGPLVKWPEGWQVVYDAITGNLLVHPPQDSGWGRIEYDKEEHPWSTGQHVPTPGEFLTWQETQVQDDCDTAYRFRRLLDVAREQARKDLPLSNYTEAYWKIDLHNLFNFLERRMETHAQKEIREYAVQIGEQIVAPLFPLCWEAFMDYRVEGLTLSRQEVESLASAKLRSHDTIWLTSIGKSENAEFVDKAKRLGINTNS